ncbi:AAA family ATPase [Candidatus Pacearchaeota archaeon]|nr:AAA family ATPase [Candidatus Pacearchaeota archaeon]
MVKKQKIKKEVEGKFENNVVHTFIPGFDRLIGEGIPHGNAVLIEGGPGSGKTIFCLNLVKTMCQKGKKVLYMSFEEPEKRLYKSLKTFGAKTEEYEKKELLYIKRFNALDIARSVEALLSEAKKELLIEVQPVLIPADFKPDIVIVDSLSSISSAFSADGIIVLYNVFHSKGERKRALEVLKMRGIAIERKIVEFDIQKGKGVTVYPNRLLKGKYILT